MNQSEKLIRTYFDVSMTSCHHYQENEDNLHKQINKTKPKTIVYCSKPVWVIKWCYAKENPKSSEYFSTYWVWLDVQTWSVFFNQDISYTRQSVFPWHFLRNVLWNNISFAAVSYKIHSIQNEIQKAVINIFFLIIYELNWRFVCSNINFQKCKPFKIIFRGTKRNYGHNDK